MRRTAHQSHTADSFVERRHVAVSFARGAILDTVADDEIHHIPAVCNNCGAIFQPSLGIGMDSESTVHVHDVAAGRCPRCGRNGRFLDGFYEVVDGVLTVAHGRTREDILELAEILRSARKRHADAAAVVRQVEEKASWFAPTLRRLRPESKNDWYSFLSLILSVLAVVQAFVPRHDASSEKVTPEQKPTTEQVVREVLRQQSATTTTTVSRRGLVRPNAQERNERARAGAARSTSGAMAPSPTNLDRNEAVLGDTSREPASYALRRTILLRSPTPHPPRSAPPQRSVAPSAPTWHECRSGTRNDGQQTAPATANHAPTASLHSVSRLTQKYENRRTVRASRTTLQALLFWSARDRQ